MGTRFRVLLVVTLNRRLKEDGNIFLITSFERMNKIKNSEKNES